MAGSIFGLPLSQRVDHNGKPLSACKLYLYAANSSSPVDSYKDFGLTEGLEHPWPIEASANGMIPAFWLADGAYRARLTTKEGVPVFDLQYVQALGPSSGEGGGGGGVDEAAIFQTGDPIWLPRSGTRTGWVRMNARTIGSAASGATERANADTQPLYEYLWNNFSNTLCAVTGGRGANAAADFAANKPIGLLDMRGRGAFGVDDMGNSAAEVLEDGTPTAAASEVGAEKQQLVTDNLPEHAHGAGSLEAASAGAHTHSVTAPANTSGGVVNAGSAWRSTGDDVQTGSAGAHTHTITGSTASVGSGIAFNKMSPGRLGTWYVKL